MERSKTALTATVFACLICFAIATRFNIQDSDSFLTNDTSARQDTRMKPYQIGALPKTLKSSREIKNLLSQIDRYKGPSKKGVSPSDMKKNFNAKLGPKVEENLAKKVGGILQEFGQYDETLTDTCAEGPSLKLADVRQLAQISFGIPDLQVTYPPCNDGASEVTCAYGSGKCCRRPQVEFVGRYYDTAVAAMALGATLEEAFAPLIHARVLAYALQSCDPNLSLKEYAYENMFGYYVKEGKDAHMTYFNSADLSMIAFPLAYEVLYELYNTMLIERMRSRRTLQLPSDSQMQKLNDAVYYKRAVARRTPLDMELNPGIVLPDEYDFKSAGMIMETSSRMEAMSRILKPTEPEGEPSSDSKLHPSLRYSDDAISIFETSTETRKTMTYPVCNDHISGSLYYPYKFRDSVWNRYEGCCAKECTFLAHYGGTFSVGSANCCSGCNRHRCSANDLDVALYLARISSVEVSSKANTGPEEITLFV